MAFLLVSSAILFSSMKGATTRQLYTFYDSSQDIYIDYNPANHVVTSVRFGSSEVEHPEPFLTSGFTYDVTTFHLSVSGYQYDQDNTTLTLSGEFERIP
ncbi:MAG: hypothetical protein WC622_05750 [Pedobacter sp.]|uniref:hypothetical protein n=1 Tax=Pedobacter sp. TaxID=1411316 RepID=UPI00356642F6